MKDRNKPGGPSGTPPGTRSGQEETSSKGNLEIVETSRGTKSELSAGKSRGKTINEIGFTDTIDLGNLFVTELTDSGSFDIRGEIWSTTFGKVIRALPIPAALINESHKMWALNEAWGRLTDDYKQLRGNPFADLMSDLAGKERISQLIEDVFAGRRPLVSEGGLRLARGHVWARLTFRSIRIKEQRFALLLVEDLTAEKVHLTENRRLRGNLERRVEERTAQLQRTNEELRLEILAHSKTLEALEASESRYREVVEDQTDMIYRFLPDGGLIFVNPVCAQFLGESPEGLYGWNVFDIMPSDYGRKLRQILEDLDVKNSSGELEYLLPDAKGEQRWTRWTIRAIFDEQGDATAFQCVGRDVTDRKAAADALRKSEELLRAVFESTRDMILIKDRNLRITHWNPASENLLGVDASQLRGKRAEDLFDPKTAASVLELDRRVLRGEVVEVETTHHILGGSMTFLEVRSPLLTPQGDVVGVCTVARDITSRKNVGTSRVAKAERFLSVSMQTTMERARIIAETDSTILLQGETGTGKDFLARWIHAHSSRANFSYISINCAALPPDLAESELFGHERGAFTGAVATKKGLLEISEGGTVLLNEIGELSLPLQAKLLTFLDTRSFLRVGGSREIHVNARLIAATHRDLRREIADGRFLEPLYYRLNVLRIDIPPLRDRLADLPVLVESLYAELTSKMLPSQVPRIEMTSIRNLSNYHWPGNVRELKNILERALMMARGNTVVLKPPVDEIAQRDMAFNVDEIYGETLGSAIEKLTKLMCDAALRRAAGNRSQAAASLGISLSALSRNLRKFGIERRDLAGEAPRYSD